MRYILDYYDTGIEEEEGSNSVEIDVRPALDSFTACKDRAKVFMLRNIPSLATILFEYPMVPPSVGEATSHNPDTWFVRGWTKRLIYYASNWFGILYSVHVCVNVLCFW